ncbi:helix-turn-helix domain-containing protein [Kosakonia cowanii]|uniref:helix-turn-helix domain-containing protein n=1 Tax=Kosakonia cowanii TaxID=208223 RepID=UPI0025AA03F3|nr:helix-turn-helix domain-containing protein [Kosakonia cowanii]MDM9614651.1 helix-turn-helix domain-containing protein [Kosakonia cowanii]MDP4559784.1 helix-turn-helix domain-containing protein [Kosakonia cowanii]
MLISESVINSISEWIDNNLHIPLPIEQLAHHSGYSKWYLQRLFTHYKGESLGRYIRNKKLNLAARDIRETDEKISLIAMRYGYYSQQTFTRMFTRYFNMPPCTYRNRNR